MPAGSALGDFAAGLTAPWRGLAFLGRHAGAWRLAAVPFVIASVLLVSVGWLLVHVTLAWVASLLPGGGALLAVARGALDVLAWILSLAVALYASLTLASPLSAKALEGLVRAHDQAAGAPAYPPTRWATSAARALASVLVGLAVGVPVALVIGVVDLLFPPASIVLVPLGTLVSGFVVAWNLLDYPFGLRAIPLADRARWMGKRAALTTGFALSSSLLLLVPGLGLLLLPAGVVGAAMVVERGGKEVPRLTK